MPKLLHFSVANYRSFLTKRLFTFRAALSAEQSEGTVFSFAGNELSVVSAVYGPNSGGKSNLVNAMGMMRRILRDSVRLNDGENIPYDPFALGDDNPEAPQVFEMTWIDDDGSTVRYGFANTSQAIASEYLLRARPGEDESPLFLRRADGIAVNDELFAEGRDLESRTNANRLFLSLVAQLGGETSKGVMNFLQCGCNVISGLDSDGCVHFTKNEFDAGTPVSAMALDFFRRIRLGFDDIEISKEEVNPVSMRSLPEEIRKLLPNEHKVVWSIHQLVDDSGEPIGAKAFRFDSFESDGTQKVFGIAGPIFDTLKRGATLVIDDLDAKFHPLISQEIVRLFTDPAVNKNHAQLLFTTHDSLTSPLLRDDQMWFVKKDRRESTDLYRLTDVVLPDGSALPANQ